MAQQTNISIIIPSYNQGVFIENAILSVQKQDYDNWELIIQDGASQDKTREVCERYANADERIRFYSEPDTGFADAVNRALAKCSGVVAGIQSSDDFYAQKSVFSQLVETLEKYPNLVLISGRSIKADSQLRELPLPYEKGEEGFLLPETIFTAKNHLSQGATFFNIKRALDLGGMDRELDIVGDTDFWIRIATCKPVSIDTIYRVPYAWGCVVYHDNQRGSDLGKFYMGRAQMWAKHWENPQVDLNEDFKCATASSSILSAVRHFSALNRDISALEDLYRRLHRGRGLPFKHAVRARLSKFSAFRLYYYKGRVQNSTMESISKYPPGYSVRWF